YIDDEANNHLRQLHEIRPNHFVFSTEEEAAQLRENKLVTQN
ncbi:peptide ABC transporter ATP-binding protein, partial [Staphylococcus aureus]